MKQYASAPPARTEPAPKEGKTLEDQDEAYIIRAVQGDEKAKEHLLEKYKHLVRSVARAYYLVSGENEDILQEGMIGLYKAIGDFRPERNVSFRNFAYLCIRRKILSFVKAEMRKKRMPGTRPVSLEHLCSSGNPGFHSIQKMEDVEEIVANRAEIEYLVQCMQNELSPLEKKVIALYYRGDTYNDMSRKLNCEIKSIDNALQRIRRKMLRHMNP